MHCVHCKYPHTHVVYTRHNDVNDTINRRRECLKCGARFTTNERLKDKISFSDFIEQPKSKEKRAS